MSIADRIKFFEQNAKKNEKPKLEPVNISNTRRLTLNPMIHGRIIMPAGGIPNYVAPAPRRNTVVVKCDQTKSSEPVIDRNSINANMSKLKAMLEQKDIREVASFKSKDTNQQNCNADDGSSGDAKSRFAAARKMFCGGNEENTKNMEIVDNKPVRNDIKKRSDIGPGFQE